MRSLITGGAGFVGGHLAEYLLGLGREVVVLDDLSTGRTENLAAVRENPRLRFVHGTVRDPGRSPGARTVSTRSTTWPPRSASSPSWTGRWTDCGPTWTARRTSWRRRGHTEHRC